jgi:rare lipoprotein A
MGVTYYPLRDAYGYQKQGIASWYGKKFHGRPTASGETYNMHAVSAAHKTLPLQTMVEVTRLDTGKKIIVRINDRGPFVGDRIIDLSYAAAQKLGMAQKGTARVRVVALVRGRPGTRGSSPVIAEPAPDFSSGRFWIQVGAFGLSENAERLRDQLLFPREKVRLMPTEQLNGKTLVRVQIGPFVKMELADEALSSAIDQGFTASFIVAE